MWLLWFKYTFRVMPRFWFSIRYRGSGLQKPQRQPFRLSISRYRLLLTPSLHLFKRTRIMSGMFQVEPKKLSVTLHLEMSWLDVTMWAATNYAAAGSSLTGSLSKKNWIMFWFLVLACGNWHLLHKWTYNKTRNYDLLFSIYNRA